MKDKTILIVDDDARNIFALAAILKAKGYECISCPGAKEAIDIVSTENKPGIILLDMMMPDMDGYEALPILKQIAPSTPVIAVTAQAMVGDREKCINAGADDYISKPVNIDALISILNAY